MGFHVNTKNFSISEVKKRKKFKGISKKKKSQKFEYYI